MKFKSPLQPARLLRRYKRFLADVDLPDGSRVTVHCPNTGAMTGCQEQGAPVWLSRSENPARKYPLTWEIVEAAPGVRVGIHTGRSNALVREALGGGLISELQGYRDIRPEVSIRGGSRFDFLLTGPRRRPCYVEVKNVTAAAFDGTAFFPDAVSARATRHLDELLGLRRRGFGTAVVFCVQRQDVHTVRPAVEIDPKFAEAWRVAARAGVMLLGYGARVSPTEIVLERPVACSL